MLIGCARSLSLSSGDHDNDDDDDDDGGGGAPFEQLVQVLLVIRVDGRVGLRTETECQHYAKLKRPPALLFYAC